MDYFRTIVEIPKGSCSMGYQTRAVFMGSCFTENIGNKLEYYKFPVDVNPFGIIYNPVSVANSLRLLLKEKTFEEDDLNYRNGQWFSFYHHGRFSHSDLENCLDNINDRLMKSANFLKEADLLFITFGTAWVYELISTGRVVSNCHKLPARDFNRYRLGVDEIVNLYKELIVSLLVFNPGLKIVFTVSPIRHWKDGAHGNQLSKSTLLLAIDQLVELFEQVTYFPSYEIVMDELRDYRFYGEDMLHMNETAVNYIWKRFGDTFLADDSRGVMDEVVKIVRASLHRPFDFRAEAHQKFIRKNLDVIDSLEEKYPFLDLKQEKEIFLKNLLK